MSILSWGALAATLCGYIILRKLIGRMVSRIGLERDVAPSRIQYVSATLKLALSLVALTIALMIIGIDKHELGIFFGSVFALLGVALFAQWSILSNLTASIIIFFFFPYRVGDEIKLLDGENSVSGKVQEISLFHVILRNDDGEIATIPNSLVFQKAVQITVKSSKKDYQPPSP